MEDEYQLLHKLKELAGMKKEYTKVQDALTMVKIKGYGVVTPDREDIALEKPELIRHGNKFGVRIKASSPSIHMIRANIETEIAPIVGTEQQAQDLIRFIDQAEAQQGIWETNIFGKTVEHNYELLAHLEEFRIFELPLLVGVSRKSMIYRLLGNTPQDALNGTTVLDTICLLKGADILRVHDVREAVETVKIVEAMRRNGDKVME